MNIDRSKLKYYGVVSATFFVLLLSTEHISQALQVVERSNSWFATVGTWIAAAGLQIFEVITAIGLSDFLMMRKQNQKVIKILILILALFFFINLFGNILYAFSNMTGMSGKRMSFVNIGSLDGMQIFWVMWAAVPIPLMGLAGVTVMSIFRKNVIKEYQRPETQQAGRRDPGRSSTDPISKSYPQPKLYGDKK